MNDQRSPFAGLFHIVEYRRTDGGHGWIPMAAFDALGVAERYLTKCSDNSLNWPWEYRLVELERPEHFRAEPKIAKAAAPVEATEEQDGDAKRRSTPPIIED